MRRTIIALLLGGSLLFAVEAHAEPNELSDGFWFQIYRGLEYRVDTKARICFADFTISKGAGITVVPCESLARRDEWKSIITWVEKGAAPR